MSRQWMPLYVADYRKDTAHLTTFQHGAYLLLIMHYWTTGGLPADDGQLGRITGMTAAQWKRTKPVMASFFDASGRHKRIDHELARAAEISRKRKEAVEERERKRSSNDTSNDDLVGVQSQSPRKKEREEDTAGAVTSIYAFEAGVIRLTKKHFDQWQDAFSCLDLKAELLARQEWAEKQGPSRWFHAMAGALNKKNSEIKAARDKPQNPRDDWRNPLAGIV